MDDSRSFPRALRVLLAVALVCGAVHASAPGREYVTADEALELAFPECEITRETVYLTKAQKKRATRLADKEVESALVYVYTATKKGELVGHAYFDTHRVRTKRETLMIAVDPEDRVTRIEILAFGEPEQYIPRGAWYAQFTGKKLDDDLRIKRDIRGVTGATLTANATTDAVRRTLAVHQVLGQPPPGAAADPTAGGPRRK